MTFDIPQLYRQFDAPIAAFDCGERCAPHNPGGKPFCCDICHAVPAALHAEWRYLQPRTDLWHIWRGDECAADPEDPAHLRAETPEHMLLLACLGPAQCQRDYRTLGCRQFPFFPYIASDLRFLGLAYEWEFAAVCWVISHLDQVSGTYRQQFIQTYDHLLAVSPAELKGYALRAEAMRYHFATRRRRIPLLHRNGAAYLISPVSERMERVSPGRLPKFGPYGNIPPP
jgi:hypothetical protein